MTREDIVRMALEVGFSNGEIDTCQLMLERFAVLVVQQEREACAKIAEEWSKRPDDVGGYIYRNIRARKSGYE